MKVSVLTPTFNRRELLMKTIDSFLEQKWPDKEMIIVDDGSTDGTNQLFECPEDSPIKYYRKQNGGISSAYNYALERSSGELICVMQDDDLFYGPYSISTRAWMFEELSRMGIGIEVLWTAAVEINERGDRTAFVTAPRVNASAVWTGDRIYTETMMWDRRIHDRIGGFDESLSCNEDWDFKIRCLMECTCMSFPNMVTAQYRRWPGNASNENIRSGRRQETERKIRDKLKERYKAVLL